MPYSPSLSSSSSSSISSSTTSDDRPSNRHISPNWSQYRILFESHGYHLDTVKDVRLHYEHYLAFHPTMSSQAFWSGYPHPSEPEDNLCKDRGLPDNLFRGSKKPDGTKVVVKAAHIHSRELTVIRYLSSQPLSTDPTNHTIPVLDIIESPRDSLAFIVQEEWNSSFAHCAPCTPRAFLQAVRQCLEGLAFMHAHRVAHLDISRSNILTNCFGAYAYIDFELSRIFPPSLSSEDPLPAICCRRGTELPPEAERGDSTCPFKVDIWALGATLLCASRATGFEVPGLVPFLQPMLDESPRNRPSAKTLLHNFDQTFWFNRDKQRHSGRLYVRRKSIAT